MLQAFTSLAFLKGTSSSPLLTVKITAYDDGHAQQQNQEPEHEQQQQQTVDVLVFPAALQYTSLPLSSLPTVISHHAVDFSTLRQPSPRPPPQLPQPTKVHDISRKLTLLVCCHGAKDGRCGARGPPLAHTLTSLVKERHLDQVQVLATSHIGGHQYAGNVVVYCPMHPSDGDWFGGLDASHANASASDAEEFLGALLEAEVGVDGGAEDERLRRWWRGRMGLDGEEQVELFDSYGYGDQQIDTIYEEEEEEEEHYNNNNSDR